MLNDQKSCQPPTVLSPWHPGRPRIRRRGRMSGFVRKCPADLKFQPLPPPTPRQVPTPRRLNEVNALWLLSEPASAPSNEPWPWNLPSSGSAGWPGSSASNHRWSAPAANRQPSPMPLSIGLPLPDSGSHPSWRSTNTLRGAGSRTSFPIAKTSFAPSSPGPGAIPLPTSGRDENDFSILACVCLGPRPWFN